MNTILWVGGGPEGAIKGKGSKSTSLTPRKLFVKY